MAAHYEQDGQASQAIEGGEMGLCLAIGTCRGGCLRAHLVLSRQKIDRSRL
jgi:hypothetical protein